MWFNLTTNDITDCEILLDLLEQLDHEIEQVSSDGGYDTFGCYDTIARREAKAIIPPRSNAKIQFSSNPKTRLIQETKICVQFIKLAANNGNRNLVIIDDH
ncbi:transposase [Nostoc flagelliforme FACHB-838]|uniref:Transposase n=1 Tax=Nostoc flagelliforme FACHB-838 TaxID=2692904 RepID=A0ABR8DXS0_9NOSO|nr:transposase [Nostoc flagelliforme]MBD2533682.1 transposase [Nostoc flagelliforme FACHB-838]